MSESTIATLVVLIVGFVAQAAYLKGIYARDIEHNRLNINLNYERLMKIDERLEQGKDTFTTVRESIASLAATLKFQDQRIDRLERKENGHV